MSAKDNHNSDELKNFIAEAKASGGSEMANCQPFVLRLCENLGLPGPKFAEEDNARNDYVFERRIDFKHGDGSTSAGRIDCYKRGSFILEAKQSSKRLKKKPNPDQHELLPEEARQLKPGHAKRGTRSWDKVMKAARKQATDYARALPVEHGYPPFLLIVDVGNVIEIYADFSGQGKNYAHFPDRQSYRIHMDDLLDNKVQQRLIAIWNEPHSLDPAKISAEVTRDIAERLAKIAKRLEGKHDAKDVAEFLMRCLFTMFAEDVELIPKKAFENLLETLKDEPKKFVPALENLWKTMNIGGYEPHMMETLKRFNGSLFKKARALPLDEEGIYELWVAATKCWRDVEPAIFGTLLERALDPRERSKLGAHYTPRAYVERLVIPTIIEPLREDWDAVQAQVQEFLEKNQTNEAIAAVKKFHHILCTTRVLDPACGTGNFLYVSLELLKRLEGEVLEALDSLGEDAPRFTMDGETVGPNQFYGLEINPRAVPIADLVLWIGFLKWQLKTNGLDSITEPVLDAYGTIKLQDAILAYDKQDLLRDETGKPLSRWDGITKKLHPITGEEIPDPDAQMELYTYSNPRPAKWPEVNFIVGNPPFIGGKDMRAELGDGYAESCWKARPHMPGSADFVMHFWDEAAKRLARKTIMGRKKKVPNPLRRFGFITTNSITQTFSRRVIEKALAGKPPISLVFAIPDHPWLKSSGKAAVRIAMTVVEQGNHVGVLGTTVVEEGLDTDTPRVELNRRSGKISGKLGIGVDLAIVKLLKANELLAHKGFMPYGLAFFISKSEARRFGLDRIKGAENFIRPYLNGRDLNQQPRGIYCIDFHECSETFVRTEFPEAYQHLLMNSKPERAHNKMKYRRENWWRFGQSSTNMRDAIENENRFIGTTETARHRLFRFLDGSAAPDQKIRVVGVQNASVITILSSRLHVFSSINFGGWQGAGNDPVYQHTQTFDPFPACITDDSNPALRDRLAELGERLDAFRKERLAEHDFLTMTGMYNVLERLRELEWVGRANPSPLAGEGGSARSDETGEGRKNNASPKETASLNAASPSPSSDPAEPGHLLPQGEKEVPPLTDRERDIHEAGLISVLKDIHDEIDRATFEAYGWEDLSDRLVGRPGATMPSPHKSKDQEEAEEEILTRLVALNLERQEEEKRGIVRWLRPEYQIPKLGHKVPQASLGETLEMDVSVIASADKPKWPANKDGLGQIRIVREILAKSANPALAGEISASFAGRNTATRKSRVEEVLATLVETGAARTGQLENETRYFIPG